MIDKIRMAELTSEEARQELTSEAVVLRQGNKEQTRM